MTNSSHFLLTVRLKNYEKKSKLLDSNTISQQTRSIIVIIIIIIIIIIILILIANNRMIIK